MCRYCTLLPRWSYVGLWGDALSPGSDMRSIRLFLRTLGAELRSHVLVLSFFLPGYEPRHLGRWAASRLRIETLLLLLHSRQTNVYVLLCVVHSTGSRRCPQFCTDVYKKCYITLFTLCHVNWCEYYIGSLHPPMISTFLTRMHVLRWITRNGRKTHAGSAPSWCLPPKSGGAL